MHCPRCGHELREVIPNARWFRHFICDECEAAYHFDRYTLVMGRTPNFALAALRKLGAQMADKGE
jgi:transposase-like protein